jgi:hypothetical protein
MAGAGGYFVRNELGRAIAEQAFSLAMKFKPSDGELLVRPLIF